MNNGWVLDERIIKWADWGNRQFDKEEGNKLSKSVNDLGVHSWVK